MRNDGNQLKTMNKYEKKVYTNKQQIQEKRKSERRRNTKIKQADEDKG